MKLGRPPARVNVSRRKTLLAPPGWSARARSASTVPARTALAAGSAAVSPWRRRRHGRGHALAVVARGPAGGPAHAPRRHGRARLPVRRLPLRPLLGARVPVGLFAEAAAQGYLVRRPNGDIWQWDLWQPGMALVYFTNPAAREWYADQLRTLLDQGIDSFKADFGERVPTDVVWHDGSDPERMHNYYGRHGRVAARRPVPRALRLRLLEPRHSAASRALRTPRSSSAGSPSACSPHTAVCTATTPTGCRGRSATKRSPWHGSSRSSSTACRTLDRQYMLGPDLLVAPGALLPLGVDDRRPDGDWLQDLTLLVTPDTRDGTGITVPDLEGRPAAVFRAAREGSEVRVTGEGTGTCPHGAHAVHGRGSRLRVTDALLRLSAPRSCAPCSNGRSRRAAAPSRGTSAGSGSPGSAGSPGTDRRPAGRCAPKVR